MAFPANDRRTQATAIAAQVLFNHDFYLDVKEDITVKHLADTTQFETLLVLGDDYTVAGFRNVNGGTITLTTTGFLPTGAAVDDLITMEGTRDIRIDDPEYNIVGAFKAETINTALRILTLEIQEVNRKSDRAIGLATSAPPATSPVLPLPIALQSIRWNAAGLALENYVTGAFPAAHADNTLVKMDGINSAVPQATGIVIDDSNNFIVVGLFDGRDVALDGATLDALVAGATTQTLTNKTLNDPSNDIHADSIHEQARNESGGTLTAGTPVYVSGFSVGQVLIKISKADATSSATMPIAGIVETDILNNATGELTENGFLGSIDTSAWTSGDELYVSTTAGVLTNVKPTGTALIEKVGIVLRSHATMGSIEVFGAGRTNDLPNLPQHGTWVGDPNGVPFEQVNALAKTVSPDPATDDIDLGYTIGSLWIDTTNDMVWVCTDITDGVAVWKSFGLDYIPIYCSDLTTELVAGAGVGWMTMPVDFQMVGLLMTLQTAGTGAQVIQCDVNDDGTTILSTKISCDATEKNSSTAATPFVFDTAPPLIAQYSLVTVDLDLEDTDDAARGLIMWLVGYQVDV